MSHGFWVVLVYLVMGEWAVGQWIVGDISFQKMYGLYGLKHGGDKWRCNDPKG